MPPIIGFLKRNGRSLPGAVLDIGGGWGQYRQWWQPGADGCYVVHDPGVEIFTSDSPATIQRFFGEGLAKPCLFVEGFGEHLPYRDGVYDIVLIKAALDHCADPAQVLAESLRVLRPGGLLLVIQIFEDGPRQEKPVRTSFAARLWRVISDPQRLRRAIRARLFHRDEPHMHHFTKGELRRMVEVAGFRDCTETEVSELLSLFAIEARKAD